MAPEKGAENLTVSTLRSTEKINHLAAKNNAFQVREESANNIW